MVVARTVLAAFLLAIAGLVAASDLWAVLVSSRNRAQGIDKHVSMVPGLSLLLCAGAYWAWPGQGAASVWLVTALDLGTWSLVVGLPYLAWQVLRGRNSQRSG